MKVSRVAPSPHLVLCTQAPKLLSSSEPIPYPDHALSFFSIPRMTVLHDPLPTARYRFRVPTPPRHAC
jgi:hypothetical protein